MKKIAILLAVTIGVTAFAFARPPGVEQKKTQTIEATVEMAPTVAVDYVFTNVTTQAEDLALVISRPKVNDNGPVLISEPIKNIEPLPANWRIRQDKPEPLPIQPIVSQIRLPQKVS